MQKRLDEYLKNSNIVNDNKKESINKIDSQIFYQRYRHCI